MHDRTENASLLHSRMKHVAIPSLFRSNSGQGSVKRMVQVTDQVAAAFDADGEANESVVDPKPSALVLRYRGMRH
jgi:hypothetical protein